MTQQRNMECGTEGGLHAMEDDEKMDEDKGDQAMRRMKMRSRRRNTRRRVQLLACDLPSRRRSW